MKAPINTDKRRFSRIINCAYWGLCSFFAIISLLGCATDRLKTSPYQAALDCADVTYSSTNGVQRLRFCVLGDADSPYGRTIAAYKITPDGKTKRIYSDLDRGFNPWKTLICELDGDPEPEIAIGVFKSTRFFPEPDNRLFIYDWNGRFISPKWLGSRLALPFVDFTFIRYPDGIDRLVALEHEGEENFLRIYHWSGFGFLSDEDPIQVGSREEGLTILKSLHNGETWADIRRRLGK